MANDPERGEFWRRFIAERCGYPAPGRLRAQLAAAEFHDFCPCGCNSFAVRMPGAGDIPPLAAPIEDCRPHGLIFEADFELPDAKTLEVLLFADPAGNLIYVEIDCLYNSEPVPEHIDAQAPARTEVLGRLLSDGPPR